MEAKKNPGKDVHRQTFKYFLIGLTISVSLVITAFEWTTVKTGYPDATTDLPFEDFNEILATTHEQQKPIPIVEKKFQPLSQNFIPTSLPENLTGTKPVIDYTDEKNLVDPNAGIFSFDLPDEDTIKIISLAEFQPKPVGGYELFYTQISKNLKYPKQAVRQGVDGRVFIEFVVDRNGKVNHIKVVKGIGAGCDEEAMRVLALTHWEPGKQRGKPVNVRMVIPMVFKVQ